MVTQTAFLVYTRSPLGKWIPVIEYGSRPTDRTESGGRRKIGRVVELAAHDEGLDLNALAAMYPNQGETA